MQGFLQAKDGKSKLPEFSEDRNEHIDPIPKLKEPIKMQEGLWVAPNEEGEDEGPTIGEITEIEEHLQEKVFFKKVFFSIFL